MGDIFFNKSHDIQGLDYCFVVKNKDVQRFLTANLESLGHNVKDRLGHINLEHFHKFLGGSAYIFTNKTYAAKDYTYHNFHSLI